MAISFTFIDDLLRDYFQYRTLTNSSRLFDNEIFKLPLEQYRADHIIEQLTVYIHQFDINNLIDYWIQIEQRLLSTLGIASQRLFNVFTKIRMNLYRCYLIHAVQFSKMEKINEFFERLGKVLQQSNDWTKEWFVLPFIKNPEENSIFQVYFSKQWNELFWISLQNFLSTAFYHMISPKIASIEENTSESSMVRMLHETSDTIPASEQQHPSNSTIISKLRNKFSSTTKQKANEYTSPESIFTRNPLLLSPEEFDVEKNI